MDTKSFRDYVYSHLKTQNFKLGEEAQMRSFPPRPSFLPPTLLRGITSPMSLRPTAAPGLLLSVFTLWQRDHMLANAPPSWAAWRLEGSLVDPPISPNSPTPPSASEKWSEASGAESSMTSPEFPF